MGFSDITAEIVELLRDNVSTLTDGMADRSLVVESRYPEDHFANQVLYVWRDSLPEVEAGMLIGSGLTAAGEVDGIGTWNVAAYIRVPGDETNAAEQLSVLAWNLIRLLYGYRQGTAYVALLVRSSTGRMLTGATGWYLGEEFDVRVRWHMALP